LLARVAPFFPPSSSPALLAAAEPLLLPKLLLLLLPAAAAATAAAAMLGVGAEASLLAALAEPPGLLGGARHAALSERETRPDLPTVQLVVQNVSTLREEVMHVVFNASHAAVNDFYLALTSSGGLPRDTPGVTVHATTDAMLTLPENHLVNLARGSLAAHRREVQASQQQHNTSSSKSATLVASSL
jgi:hypothetical protein